jgi:AraC-like DNA-binding protein
MDMSYRILRTPNLPQLAAFHLETAGSLTMRLFEAGGDTRQPSGKFSHAEMEQLYTAKAFIDKHFPQQYTIQQVARKIGMNQQKLKTGFKEVFQQSIYAYQSDQKITIAKAHLAGSTKPVKIIAKLVGFKSEPNFCIAFKRATGLTPLQHRKLHTNEVL